MSRTTTPVPTMKGCLKSPVPTPGRMGCVRRKCVAFGEEEEVHVADVWDRTPTEPARRLSYQDLLELKEIQRSLPRAQQLPDPVSGKPPSYLLDHVPIGLLPLLPAPAPARPPPPPSPPSPTCPLPAPAPRPPAAPSTSWVPAHMQHLVPTRAPPPPHRPAFAFLPLLDPRTRSPSPDPPTPALTNASLDSSPLSRASSASSPEPLDLDPPHPPSPTTAWHPFPRPTPKPRPPPACPKPRRRNVMILNGIEICLDDDAESDDTDDDAAPAMPRPSLAASPRRCAMALQYPRNVALADVASPWAG